MNRTIKLLMLSDIFVVTGFGLISPILAIFINDNLPGGSIFSAGLAAAIFLVTKSAVQMPFSRYADRSGNKLRGLIAGSFIVSMVPFIYIFATDISYVYLAEVMYGFGSGLAFPTWLGLWSVSLDKGKESFEWSLYSTLTGIGSAATAAIGAAISQFIGFAYTFVLVSMLSLTGCLILFCLESGSRSPRKACIGRFFKKAG